MAYEIISQNNNTTTLSDGTNTITVPGHVTLATSTSYTITEVNNNTATLEGSDGSVIRDVPCIAVLAGGGSSDTHNKGFFATQAALEEAYPTGEAGDYAIVGATDTVWIWDEDSSAWVDTDTKGQVESVNAKTGEVVLTAIDVSAVPEYSAMPVASADTANQIVLYSGATNGTYTHGYFYANKVSVTESSATASQTTGNSLSDVAVNKLTFETQITETGNYKFIFDGTNWTYDDEPVNVADYGITFTGTPVADDVITVVYGARVYLYYWEQINVQPSVDPLPSQTGKSGYVLGTDGFVAGWVKPEIVQVSALPAASEDEVDNIYQFVGTTDANYTNGYFYKCVSDGQNPATYSWTQTDVQPSVDPLPSQSGNNGKFLTTNGTSASWATVDALPTQTGHNGEVLITNGTTASWTTPTTITFRTWGANE